MTTSPPSVYSGLSPRDWGRAVALPLGGVLLVDQAGKLAAVAYLPDEVNVAWLRLVRYDNHGFMFSWLADLPRLFTVVLPSTVGAFLVYALLIFQYFVPLRSLTMRVGVSLYVAGVLGNIVDRVARGFVIDFIQIQTPWVRSGIFNPGDTVQWIGAALFLGSFIANRAVLYPPDQRRGRLWIDADFQGRFCGLLLGIGASFSLVTGILSYTVLRETISSFATADASAAVAFVKAYCIAHLVTATIFLLTLALVGIHLSHRIVGPIRAFEVYLDDLTQGRMRQLRLRQTDELRQLEQLGDRLHDFVHMRMGITAKPLAAGNEAPNLGSIDLGSVGKLWLIFYRYAGCPLCSVHAHETLALFRDATTAGVRVIAVFEAKGGEAAEGGDHADGDQIKAMLKAQGVEAVVDHERALYRRFRTRVRLSGLLRPKTLWTLVKAHRLGYRQGRIDGALGQMPAHFLIRGGRVEVAHYAATVDDHISRAQVERFIAEA